MDGLKNIIAKRVDAMKAGAAKRRQWSHSPTHDLADQISRTFGEPKRFAAYLGVINRVGEVRARSIFGEVTESSCDNPRKLFFWKCREAYRLEHPETAAPQDGSDRPIRPRVRKARPPKQLPLI